MTGYRAPGVAESRGGGTTSAFLLPDASAPESTHEFYLRHVRLSRTREGGNGLLAPIESFLLRSSNIPLRLPFFQTNLSNEGEKNYIFSIPCIFIIALLSKCVFKIENNKRERKVKFIYFLSTRRLSLSRLGEGPFLPLYTHTHTPVSPRPIYLRNSIPFSEFLYFERGPIPIPDSYLSNLHFSDLLFNPFLSHSHSSPYILYIYIYTRIIPLPLHPAPPPLSPRFAHCCSAFRSYVE